MKISYSFLSFIFLLYIHKSINPEATFKKENYLINIKSIGNSIIDTNKTYFLEIANNSTQNIDELQNEEYCKSFEEALKFKNYHRINDTINSSFKFLIRVEYSITGAGKKTKSSILSTIPNTQQQNQTIATTTTTQGTFRAKPDNSVSYQGTSTTKPSTNPYVLPQNSMTISSFGTNSINEFKRTLHISCFQKNKNTLKEVWFVNANSKGESDDLSSIIPVLSFATIQYIEYNSKSERQVKISSKNKNLIQFINSIK